MALPAPNSDASTCSRTTPRTRLVMVAAPADAAERARLAATGRSGSKLAADRFVDRLAVGVLSRELRHHRLHHLAHVLRRGRAGLGDCGGDGGLDYLR